LLQHALQGAVERAGAQLEVIVRAGRDLLNDGVPVAITRRQGDQDMKRRRRQREQYVSIIPTVDILSMAILVTAIMAGKLKHAPPRSACGRDITAAIC
jgi:hypothetical protein